MEEPTVTEDTQTVLPSLDDLPQAGPAKISSLKDAGFTTLRALANSSVKEIVDKTSFGEAGAKSAIAWARSKTGIGGFQTGSDYEEHRLASLRRLTTGSVAFDNLLISESAVERGEQGGIEAGCIFEIFGEWGSTKTQIAHQLAVNVQLPVEQGGFGGKAIFIDTERTFRPERIRDMALHRGLDPDEVLNNIFVCRAPSTELQIEAVKNAVKFGEENDVGAIIVDSLTANFRAEWSGRGELADRQQTLMRHMEDLSNLADALNAVCFVTNQVMKDPAAGPYADPTKSVGGDVVGHTSKFRVYLRKAKDPKRIARLVDSPDLPVREAVINITGGGIVDE